MIARVAFRVDASPQIGIGHFMRCLTLANALAGRGAQVRFVTRHLPGHLAAMARARGFECRENRSFPEAEPDDPLGHAHWLGTSQDADAQDTLDALSDQPWDWLVIDHYALDQRWERRLRTVSRRVLAIDDVADRVHDCDILLDQNVYEDMDSRYAGMVPPSCATLLGPRFALLRPDFRERRAALPPRTGRLGRLLICFGGIDAHNLTALALAAVDAVNASGLEVDVVIGAQHPDRGAIEARCAARGFACHVQSDRMAELMAAADLAYGASGSTSWERCCMALPTICAATAHNQVAIARGLEHAGAIVLVGDREPVSVAGLTVPLDALMRAPARLLAMSAAAAGLVDGLGTDRVYDAMAATT